MAFISSFAPHASANEAECVPLSAEGANELTAILVTVAEQSDCAINSVETTFELSRTEWHTSDGTVISLVLAPQNCMDEVTVRGRQLDVHAGDDFQQQCPQAWAGLITALGLVTLEVANVSDMDDWWREEIRNVWAAFDSPDEVEGASRWRPKPREQTGPRRQHHRRNTHQWMVASIVTSGLWIWLALLLVRRRPSPLLSRTTAAWAAMAVGALIVRLAVRPGLANWYTEVMPSFGNPHARFGYGVFVVQEAFWTVLPQSDTTWQALNLAIGALTVPLAVAFMRNLGLSKVAWMAGGVFLCMSPLHVRICASPSEHVLASAYLLGAMLAWTSGARNARKEDLALGWLLAVGATLVRVDMFAQAAVLPLWGWAATRSSGRSATKMFVCFFVTWGAVGVWTYSNVVLSAAHPRPSVSEMWEKLQGPILSQFVDLATSPPYFASAIVIALAALGAAVMLLRRFRLFVAFVCLLLCTFLPVYGSFSRDGILSARYFLVFLVALATVAGYGLSVLLPCRWPRWAANAVIAAIALSVLVFSNASYHVRYTFQDEFQIPNEKFLPITKF